jgi:hypothetical protein
MSQMFSASSACQALSQLSQAGLNVSCAALDTTCSQKVKVLAKTVRMEHILPQMGRQSAARARQAVLPK